MREGCLLLLLLLLLFSLFCLSSASRIVEKVSFRAPFTEKENDSYVVPNWTIGGNASVSQEAIRLTKTQREQKGWIWANEPLNATAWSILVEFRVGGDRIGADGFVFWYVEKPFLEGGDLFGSSSQFRGMGLFFDTFDNDASNTNPFVGLVLSLDGNNTYDTTTDGFSSVSSGCVAYFRNAQKSQFKLVYTDKTILVEIDKRGGGWEYCAQVEATLPTGYYLGFSAATGLLYDSHEIYSASVYDLSVNISERTSTPERPSRIKTQNEINLQKRMERIRRERMLQQQRQQEELLKELPQREGLHDKSEPKQTQQLQPTTNAELLKGLTQNDLQLSDPVQVQQAIEKTQSPSHQPTVRVNPKPKFPSQDLEPSLHRTQAPPLHMSSDLVTKLSTYLSHNFDAEAQRIQGERRIFIDNVREKLKQYIASLPTRAASTRSSVELLGETSSEVEKTIQAGYDELEKHLENLERQVDTRADSQNNFLLIFISFAQFLFGIFVNIYWRTKQKQHPKFV